MLKPVPLPPSVRSGARVGVAALSGPVDSDRLDAGLQALRELGFEPVEASNLRGRHGLFAGDDDSRVAGFHELAARDDVEAIVFARGGWGVLRILDRIDWDLLRRRPRAYVGYSDLTPFLQQVIERLGVAVLHGPMVAADLARGLDDRETESFVGALEGRFPDEVELHDRFGVTEVPSVPVEGVLLGGCLSLLVSTLGTPWAAELAGSLLLVEDLDEPPYRVDRMLTHLRLSGTLTRIVGMIVGHLHCEGRPEPTAWDGEVTLRGVLREMARDFSWPLVEGLDAGHAAPNLTLPLGTLCSLAQSSHGEGPVLRLAIDADVVR